MNDINELLVCPDCGVRLKDHLLCGKCGSRYPYHHGVYYVISKDRSEKQSYHWEVTDEMLAQDEEADWVKDYYARKNPETVQAEVQLDASMNRLIHSLSGTVCDLATGRGRMLQRLLDYGNENIQIVCTDLDPRILTYTRMLKQTDDRRVFYVAADCRYLPFEDQCFDAFVTLYGFGNIPEGARVARELYRTLKPGGEAILQTSFIEPDSKSYEIAKDNGVDRGMVEEFLLEDLRNAGFCDVSSTIIAEAIWAKNPYDLIPAAGDMQRFSIVRARKASK